MMNVNMISRALFLFLTFLFLTGCAVSPRQLGISQSEWNQYSAQQQNAIRANYNHAERTKKPTQPKTNSELAINVQGGTVLMPPNFEVAQSYQPISFHIKDGDCRVKIPVYPANGSNKQAKLLACYQDDILYLDPSPYQPNKTIGALQLPYMPIWQRGFTYPNVSSTGYLHLSNANISVSELSSNR